MARNFLTRPTSKNIQTLLPRILKKIDKSHEMRPDLILAAWPQMIGERMAPMTKAVSFTDGVLTIKVKNSSLLSLLTQYERPRLLREFRKKFPKVTIQNIRFMRGV